MLRLSRTKREQSLDSVNGAAIAESETGSLDDYINTNPRKYNEDASYIGASRFRYLNLAMHKGRVSFDRQ